MPGIKAQAKSVFKAYDYGIFHLTVGRKAEESLGGLSPEQERFLAGATNDELRCENSQLMNLLPIAAVLVPEEPCPFPYMVIVEDGDGGLFSDLGKDRGRQRRGVPGRKNIDRFCARVRQDAVTLRLFGKLANLPFASSILERIAVGLRLSGEEFPLPFAQALADAISWELTWKKPEDFDELEIVSDPLAYLRRTIECANGILPEKGAEERRVLSSVWSEGMNAALWLGGAVRFYREGSPWIDREKFLLPRFRRPFHFSYYIRSFHPGDTWTPCWD